HEQQHEVGADGKISGVVGDDKGVEVISRSARFQGLTNKTDDVAAERVHFAVELDAADAVAEIDERCTGIFLHHAVGLLCDGDRPHAGGDLNGLQGLSSKVPV